MCVCVCVCVCTRARACTSARAGEKKVWGTGIEGGERGGGREGDEK